MIRGSEKKKERVTTRMRNKYERELKKFSRKNNLDINDPSTVASFDSFKKMKKNKPT
jgi:hypothetical protein|tara:strand:+ start:270 stop:440 length:171 start_codon:yes stop_codon:yes gene_type:complete